ncbi:hypothetical protein SGPA1_40662 [Streptomyces misionensis JCM 4497]
MGRRPPRTPGRPAPRPALLDPPARHPLPGTGRPLHRHGTRPGRALHQRTAPPDPIGTPPLCDLPAEAIASHEGLSLDVAEVRRRTTRAAATRRRADRSGRRRGDGPSLETYAFTLLSRQAPNLPATELRPRPRPRAWARVGLRPQEMQAWIAALGVAGAAVARPCRTADIALAAMGVVLDGMRISIACGAERGPSPSWPAPRPAGARRTTDPPAISQRRAPGRARCSAPHQRRPASRRRGHATRPSDRSGRADRRARPSAPPRGRDLRRQPHCQGTRQQHRHRRPDGASGGSAHGLGVTDAVQHQPAAAERRQHAGGPGDALQGVGCVGVGGFDTHLAGEQSRPAAADILPLGGQRAHHADRVVPGHRPHPVLHQLFGVQDRPGRGHGREAAGAQQQGGTRPVALTSGDGLPHPGRQRVVAQPHRTAVPQAGDQRRLAGDRADVGAHPVGVGPVEAVQVQCAVLHRAQAAQVRADVLGEVGAGGLADGDQTEGGGPRLVFRRGGRVAGARCGAGYAGGGQVRGGHLCPSFASRCLTGICLGCASARYAVARAGRAVRRS